MTSAEHRLRQAGLRCTRHRLEIFRLLLAEARPLSHQQVMQRLPGFDRVTVYRTLDCLVTAGVVHRAFLEQRCSYFEAADRCGDYHCHPHFTCSHCGQTTCLDNVAVPQVQGLHSGFVAHRQKVHITGLCPGCSGPGGGL